jgi:glucokinase
MLIPEIKHAIGIDLGGTHIKGVLLTDRGQLLASDTRPTKDGQAPQGANWKQTIAEMIARLTEQSPKPPIAVGIAAPGIAMPDFSGIEAMPGRLEGLEHFQWSEFIGREVVVVNDAHSALIAEHTWGNAKGVDDVMLLTLGTGVGGGVLIKGQLQRGHDQRAGHLGHISLQADSDTPGISGMPGSLEYAIGDYSIAKRSFGRFATTQELVKAYERGDTFATYVWLNSIRKLALGICSLCNALSPQMVLLGGGITQAKKSLFEPLHDFVELFEWRPLGVGVDIQPAKYLKWSGAFGAASAALHRNSYLA